jgi:CheY-like chemotaxis protein
MREVLETLLTAEGYRVDLAKTGEEGLEAYGRRAFDVVLLDVSMPGIGGLRALEEFLKMDPEAVIVMITGLRNVRHRNRSVGARRGQLHPQAVSKRTDHAHDSGRNQTTAQGRRTTHAAARDE